MKKVSVIIPMYNEERYIGRCLDSLKNQTYKDFEVILIDDGSKDDTVKIAESYNKDFQLKILKQNHGGPGKARNRGAKEAQGDILIFVDSDMHFDKDYINCLIKPILDGKEIGCNHKTELVGNTENSIAVAYSAVKGILKDNERTGVYRAILKKTFIENGGFNIELGYGDDNLSHINNGLGSYCAKGTICYHNNPETFGEIYKHEKWVGASFSKFSVVKPYIITYKRLLILLSVFAIGGFFYLVKIGKLILLPLLLLGLLVTFLLYKTIRRYFIDRKYIERNPSYLLYVGPVLCVRGAGVLVGFLGALFKKRIY